MLESTTEPQMRIVSTKRTQRRLPRRLLAYVLAGLLVLGGSLAGYRWWLAVRNVEWTDDAYVGGDVTVIAPKVSGIIETVAVTDNQAVHTGDVLVRLDARDFNAALAKAEAGVAAEQAAIEDLAATRRLQEATIAQAEAAIKAADALTQRTHNDWRRYHTLVNENVVAVQTFQQAEADYTSAQAESEKNRAALLAAKRQMAVLDARRQQTEAALDQARAERDIARLNLEYTVIRAPMAGTIGNRSAREGAYVVAGSQLLSIVPADGLWVDANFKENQLAGLRPGLPAIITADALPGTVFTGRISSIAPATGAQFSVLPPENATGNFTKIVQRVPVRILLDGDGSALGRLRPGLSVTAEVDTRPAARSPR